MNESIQQFRCADEARDRGNPIDERTPRLSGPTAQRKRLHANRALRNILVATFQMGWVALILAGCGPNPGWTTTIALSCEDEAAIERFTQDYARAFESEDANAIVSLMTDDFVALTPEKPPIIGREAVHQAITSDLETFNIESLQFVPAEIVINGPWAWTWGRSKAVMTSKTNDDVIKASGKYLWILQRQGDGSWRIARDSAQAD